jgi:phosphate transport system protein
MREALERDLNVVRGDFIRMLSYTSEQLNLASKVLLEVKVQHAETVHNLDREVDILERKIEEECVQIIARHQPVAIDLRLVSAIYRSISDIERIGDYAGHVADDAKLLANEPPLKRYINLGQMIARLKTMIETTIRAFTERDAALATEAAGMDNEIDDLYEQIQRELVTYMIEDPRTITKVLALLRVGRSLQRIGDHIENVSERLNYWLTGERV